MKKVLFWFKIIRPQTLFASICPVTIGLLCTSHVNWTVALVTMLCALSLQIFSNLVNDYYDFVRGLDKSDRTGPRRALAEGLLNKKQMLNAVKIVFVLTMLLGFILLLSIVLRKSFIACIPIVATGISAVFFAWLYTATDHSLSYLGIADIFVFLYFGVIASTGTFYLQMFDFSLKAFFAGAVCGLISMCVLMINNLRDIEGDASAGKKTFPVRFGKRAGELGMLAVILLMPVFSYLAFGFNLSMFILLSSLLLFFKTLKANGKKYNKCLFYAGLNNVLYVILVVLENCL